MVRVEISGLQPFNESLFFNCTYPIRFAILRYYGRPITPIVFNEDYRFACAHNYENGRSLLYCTTHFVEELDNVLTRTLGLAQTKYSHRKDVVTNLKQALASGRPVMLMIDRYFQSSVPQYFQREHFLHSILVYGYDDTAGTFLLFDDLCQQQNKIVACSMSYEEITEAYASCHEQWPSQVNDTGTFIIFSAEDRPSDFTAVNSQARAAFIRHLFHNRAEIDESICNLTTFAGLFEEQARQGEASSALKYYYHVFRRMAEIKETQRYQCKCLLDGNSESEIAIAQSDALVRHWNIMRIRTMRASANPNRAAVDSYVSDISAKLQAVIPLEAMQQAAFLGAVHRAAQETSLCR